MNIAPHTRSNLFRLVVSASLLLGAASSVPALEGEDYEEDAGNGFNALINPSDEIYGGSVEAGTWLKGTPLFGNLVISGFYSKPQEAWYGGLGMIFRLMPHWMIAPFVGGGGSYNLAFDQDNKLANTDKGESFWAGHAEGGVRYWFKDEKYYAEAFFRQTWTSLDYESDYWLGGLGYGIRY